MIDKVLQTIKRYCMLEPGDRVIMGLSGGADSMALAFFFHSIKKEWCLDLTAVHVNHGLRGEEAQRDAAFVKAWCKCNHIPCHVMTENVSAYALEKGISLEQAGREARYRNFFCFADKDTKIATAHHLNDAMETALFHLARGTSPDGLGGIPPVRGQIIRPLIDCTRQEIEDYCAQNNIPYVTDSTNAANDYSRNRLRNQAIPVLRTVNPSVETAFARFFTLMRQDTDYFAAESRRLYQQTLENGTLDCIALTAMHPSLRNRVLRLFLEENAGVSADFQQTSAVERIALQGGQLQLTPSLTIKRFKNRLTAANEHAKHPVHFEIVNKLVLEHEEFLNISENQKNSFHFYADYDKMKGNILVRSRLPGDKISLAGRGCTKTLKKYFNECGIPVAMRESIPVLVDDLSVIGIVGFACHSRVQIDENTKQVLLIDVRVNDAERHGIHFNQPRRVGGNGVSAGGANQP